MTDEAQIAAAEVAVDAPLPAVLTYLIPENLALKVGQLVQVPLRGREVTGYVLSLGPKPPASSIKYKYLKAILKEEPLFGPDFVRLANFVAQYYFYPIGLCVKDILPGGLAPKLIALVSLTDQGINAPDPAGEEVLRELRASYPEPIALDSLANRGLAFRLAKQGQVAIDWRMKTRGLKHAFEWYVAPAPSLPQPLPRLGPKVQELWRRIVNTPPTPLSHYSLYFKDPLAKAYALENKGLVTLEKRVVFRDDPNRAVNLPIAPVETLTPDQATALDVLNAGLTKTLEDRAFRGYLLFGVTGSGKTEIYLRAAAKTLAAGRGVVWLAPEISLTLGLESRLKANFPKEKISVLHSALTPGQRHDHWLSLVTGESRLALGARSAVFAPVKDPGLIIVDEEHDWAYKQDDGLRYHGRDLAAWRARDQGAVLILGSATPSLESYHAALEGRLTLLKLTTRPGTSVLPTVELLDLKEGRRRRPIDSRLATALKATLERGEQALLFLNRRGLANVPLCLNCGQVLKCPHCNLAFTLHGPTEPFEDEVAEVTGQTLICHSCGRRMFPPKICPACQSKLFKYVGVGTEKLLKIVGEEYQAKALRLDADSASLKGGTKNILESFGRREADVLVGTQMAAKGHDFPDLTLVGVVEADLGLHSPDFRAAERTFQLLSQVSGRAGRRERPGQVLIQTLCPNHIALTAAKDHDYLGFYQEESANRKELGLPPFGRLALIRIVGPDNKTVEKLASKAADIARSLIARLEIKGLELLGPAPAPHVKLRDKWRYQMLVRAGDHRERSRLLNLWLPKFRASLPAEVILVVDVDPYHLL
ncbi:MAG: primosomal protein N' [Deltaproteobacteria bacterium]|nr:primosomal protein N' [Deltaproteobacteria bacterium]